MSNNKNFVVKNGLDVGLDITANNVTANTFIGDLTGNADTATTLATSRTISLGGDLSGSASFDGSSNITISASLTKDPVITLSGAVTGSATMTNLGNVTITTTATSDPTITLAGDLSGSATLTNLGNATLTATITKDPVITLSGDVTGSATMTNLGNVTITTTVADDSHNHIISNVDGLQTALDGKLDSSDIGSTVLAYDSNLQSFVTAFTLPTVDGSVNQVLKTNGSGTISFSTAQDLLELYAENPSSPVQPLVGGLNAVAVGSGSNGGGDNSVALGVGSAAGDHAFSAVITGGNTAYGAVGNYSIAMGQSARAEGTNSIGIGYLSRAVSTESMSIGPSTDANSYRSLAIGYNAQTSVGANATALTNSYASGADSFAAAIANNTSSYGATGTSSVAIGKQAKASGLESTSVGGTSALSTGQRSVVLGGDLSEATGNLSYAYGWRARSNINSKSAYGVFVGFAVGEAQGGYIPLAASTTDATPTVLVSDGSAAGTTNQIILPNNSAYAFHGTIVARQQAADGTACAAWELKGLIRREGSAGTTVLVNSIVNTIDNTPSWSLALSADTTNGGLAITVTGAAATNIRWVATVHTSEVTYS